MVGPLEQQAPLVRNVSIKDAVREVSRRSALGKELLENRIAAAAIPDAIVIEWVRLIVPPEGRRHEGVLLAFRVVGARGHTREWWGLLSMNDGRMMIETGMQSTSFPK